MIESLWGPEPEPEFEPELDPELDQMLAVKGDFVMFDNGDGIVFGDVRHTKGNTAWILVHLNGDFVKDKASRKHLSVITPVHKRVVNYTQNSWSL